MRHLIPGLILVASCATTSVPDPDDSALIHDIDRAESLWSGHTLRSYRFVYSSSTFGCGTPSVVVTVRHDLITSVRFVDDHNGCQGLDLYRKGQDASTAYPLAVRTIDDHFKEIHRLSSLGVVAANFHPEYGFPIRVSFVNPELSDDFGTKYIREFEFLEN